MFKQLKHDFASPHRDVCLPPWPFGLSYSAPFLALGSPCRDMVATPLVGHTSWLSGRASALCSEGPGFDPNTDLGKTFL